MLPTFLKGPDPVLDGGDSNWITGKIKEKEVSIKEIKNIYGDVIHCPSESSKIIFI